MAKGKTGEKAYIYIMKSDGIPGYVKIGYTTDLERRRKELGRSSPKPFQIYAYYEIKEKEKNELDPDSKEKKEDLIIHKLIDTINPSLRAIDEESHTKKEFFEMSPETAYEILESMAEFAHTSESLHKVGPNGKITKARIETEEKIGEKKDESNKIDRRPPFSFAECGIEPGSIITFYKDENIKAKVLDDTNVEFEGISYSITGLTKKILNLDEGKSIQGPAKWKYEGELLTKRRARLEKDGLYK